MPAAVALYGASLSFIMMHTFSSDAATVSQNAVRVVCGVNHYFVMPDELELYGKEALCTQFE
ncbi:hypothetical protein HQQ94_02930 [Shewanella sp. VB17]|uniref:hypothetical protein n=1 Tax=Shewanella sp. VB17 TaxID=2739432 RepID=UPI0015639076|nr:hypothetical protein [Shewanella sp. VB17]NRD72207.1 hypothetical protein [Shewanella sp. VB17]